MIPHIEALLDMHRRGEMPMRELVIYVVKKVALQATREDFDELPPDLKTAISDQLTSYQRDGGWVVVSNMGMEDYSRYADACLAKLGMP